MKNSKKKSNFINTKIETIFLSFMVGLLSPHSNFICYLYSTLLGRGILRGECRLSQVSGVPAHGLLAVGFFLLPATGLSICPILVSQSLLPMNPPSLHGGWVVPKRLQIRFSDMLCTWISERLAPLPTTTNYLSNTVDTNLVHVLVGVRGPQQNVDSHC